MMPAAIQAPIIVIGAGRSGSTLLSRMFSAHRSIDFKGETSFLLLRLWVEVWHNKFWLNWARHVATGPTCAAHPLPPLAVDQLAAERTRVGRLLAELIVGLLRVELRPYGRWGYKELWSGLDQYNHNWCAYDAVLPGAHWLHLVRHPFDFARSCADWNGTTLTMDYLEARLSNWVSMLSCNRLRHQTGRYYEVRFEDLVQNPEGMLGPVLDAVELRWEPAMGRVLQTRTMSSRGDRYHNELVLTAADAQAVIERVPGLAVAMATCGYVARDRMVLAREARPERSIDLQRADSEDLDRYPPRYALEAQLHQVRTILPRLTELLKEYESHVDPADTNNREATLERIFSTLATLADSVKQ